MAAHDSIAVLAGGGGTPKYVRGLIEAIDAERVTVIVNTGDDLSMHGLRICPDLDSCTYVLADAVNRVTGWGLAGETWSAMDALRRFESVVPAGSSAGVTWFGLGDRDLATHLYRTARLGEGADLKTVTEEITRAYGIAARVLPMTTDPVATMVSVDGEGEIAFQEYFVHRHHDVPITAVRFAGIDLARPGPGVLAALETAERVVIGPSNPFVSIDPILAVAGVRERLAARRESVVAVSPIVAGEALKGPADRMLRELGHDPSVVGIARIYADLAATLVIDDADAAARSDIEATGMRCVVTPTIMRDVADAIALAEVTLK